MFSFTATASTPIYTLSLHDALPIYTSDFLLVYVKSRLTCKRGGCAVRRSPARPAGGAGERLTAQPPRLRSEEHTSELQSLRHLVCRLLLEKKNTKNK